LRHSMITASSSYGSVGFVLGSFSQYSSECDLPAVGQSLFLKAIDRMAVDTDAKLPERPYCSL
jgi:hypothetical protein